MSIFEFSIEIVQCNRHFVSGISWQCVADRQVSFIKVLIIGKLLNFAKIHDFSFTERQVLNDNDCITSSCVHIGCLSIF